MSKTNGGKCPVCGRYVGPVKVCPYCDEDIRQPAWRNSLRLAALLLAFIGLGLLYLTARVSQPPLIAANRITPAMNFAHVKMRGKVIRRPYIGRDGDYCSFRLDDGSGRLVKVFARGRTARTLIGNGLLPSAGAVVAVRGSLHVSADATSLEIRLPGHLEVVSEVDACSTGDEKGKRENE